MQAIRRAVLRESVLLRLLPDKEDRRGRRLVSSLRDNRGLVLAILGDGYLNRYFWQDPDSMRAGKSGRIGRRKAEIWYAEQAWGILLEQAVERIYLLRCRWFTGPPRFAAG